MPQASAAPAALPRQHAARLRRVLQSGEAAVALRLLGDRWVLLVLRDAFLGVRRFDDLQRRGGAPRSTLTSRLAALVEAGILYRREYATRPRRLEYRRIDADRMEVLVSDGAERGFRLDFRRSSAP